MQIEVKVLKERLVRNQQVGGYSIKKKIFTLVSTCMTA